MESKEGRIFFSRFKGIDVIDAEGNRFGHVDDIEMNKTTLTPTHLLIHKGFFGEHFRINMKYIDRVVSDKIILWISPIKTLMGTIVTDSKGNDIGTVKHAVKNQEGKLEYLIVEARIIRKRKEDREVDRFIVPMMPFEDISLTLPSAMGDSSISLYYDLRTGEITVMPDDIESVHKDRIVLARSKEEYLQELREDTK